MSKMNNKWSNTKPSWQDTISIKPRTGSLTIEQIGLRFSDIEDYSSNTEKATFDDFESQRRKRMFEFIPDTMDYLSGNYTNSSYTSQRAERLNIVNGNTWQVGHYIPAERPWAKDNELTQIILRNKHADFSTFLAVCMYIKAKEKNFPLLDADVIVPVPNFDTSENVKAPSIAKKLARIMNNESFGETAKYQNVLNKKINKQTHSMSWEEKKTFYAENQVYEFNSNCDIHEKNVILIDDVVTAGFSAKQCLNELKKNGASKVSFYATATTQLRSGRKSR